MKDGIGNRALSDATNKFLTTKQFFNLKLPDLKVLTQKQFVNINSIIFFNIKTKKQYICSLKKNNKICIYFTTC